MTEAGPTPFGIIRPVVSGGQAIPGKLCPTCGGCGVVPVAEHKETAPSVGSSPEQPTAVDEGTDT